MYFFNILGMLCHLLVIIMTLSFNDQSADEKGRFLSFFYFSLFVLMTADQLIIAASQNWELPIFFQKLQNHFPHNQLLLEK